MITNFLSKDYRAAVGSANRHRKTKVKKMKLHLKVLLTAVAIAGSAACLIAQDGNAPRQRPQGGPDGQRPPLPPLIAALDANHDGVIDAAEIDNAPAALRTLDKNGDGKLTQDEIRPPRPGGPDGQRPNFRNGQRPPLGPGGPGHEGQEGQPNDNAPAN